MSAARPHWFHPHSGLQDNVSCRHPLIGNNLSPAAIDTDKGGRGSFVYLVLADRNKTRAEIDNNHDDSP